MRNPKKLRLFIPKPTNSVGLQQRQQNNEFAKQVIFETNKPKDSVQFTSKDKPQDEKKEVSPTIPYFYLFKYSTIWEKFMMLVGVACGIITGLAIPANTYIFGDLVESVVLGAATNNNTRVIEAVTEFAIGNSVIGAIMLTLTYLGIMIFNFTAQKQSFRVRHMYLRSVLHQDIGWYDVVKSGDMASTLTEDVIKFEDGIGEKVPMFLQNVFAFIGSIVLAFVRGWKLTLVCIICVPVMSVILACILWITSSLTKKQVRIYGVAGGIAEEVLSSIRTVVAFGGQAKEHLRYTSKLEKTYKTNVKKGYLTGVALGSLWLSIYASYALSFWYGVKLILEDAHLPYDQRTYTANTMITVFFSIMMGSINIGAASPFVEAFATAKAAAAKIFSIMKRKPPIDSLSTAGLQPTDIEGSIEFKNVSFEYPSREGIKVLQNLNFSIKKGESVALVGSSGCGKSTCIQLLQRFYDASEGQILIDGYDIRDLNIKWLRSRLGIVGQEPVLFNTTIEENIRYGSMEASMDKIVSIAKKANAHKFIWNLPYQYNTLVGENGTQISGGQKQRIAIARALIRDPKILLLDEATSALDTHSEAKVQEALDKVHKGRTTIIVAHRLSTISHVDKIIVISEGKVVEEGNHNNLMERKGHYYSLVTTQVSTLPPLENAAEERNKSPNDEDDVESVLAKYDDGFDETETVTKPVKVSTFKILKLNKPEWRFNIMACITSILVGCSMPLFSILLGDIIGVLSERDPVKIRSETNIYCLYFVIGGFVVGISNFVQIYLFSIAGERLTRRLRGLTFESMLRQEIAWFDRPENGTGALCAKLSTEVATIQGAIGLRIGTIIQSIATIFLSIGLSLYYEWRLGLVGVAFIPIILVVTYLQGLVIRQETLNYHSSLEESTKIAVEAVSNVRTVASLCREDTFYEWYVRSLEVSLKTALLNSHLRGLVYGLARSIIYFAYAACMYYGGILIQDENLFYANIFKVAQALIMGTVMVANASAFAPDLQKGLVSAGEVIALFERKPKIQDPEYKPKENWDSDANVKYKRVTFEYPTRPGTRVLDEMSLDVLSGQNIALIGSSGCGKSTIIQLLERFYDPDAGTIDLSNTNITNVPQSALRMQLGLVSQEPVLFARSIAENIAYGDNTREVPMVEIIEAARKANLHDFVATLPFGYDTKLGERGTQLSGGQKQRVAIARALVRNPKILLLDEATSALDSESENVVQDALDSVKEGRTCITIAHRLSTIKNADKICVVRNGTIAEYGNHDELVSRRGLYFKLLCSQNPLQA